ncbi:MAG: hypothetical protein ACO390_00960 [bacterium]
MRKLYIDLGEAIPGILWILVLIAIAAIYWNPTKSVFRNAGYQPTNLVHHHSIERDIIGVCNQESYGDGITFLSGDIGEVMAGSQSGGEILWICNDARLSALLGEEIRLDRRDSEHAAFIVQQSLY